MASMNNDNQCKLFINNGIVIVDKLDYQFLDSMNWHVIVKHPKSNSKRRRSEDLTQTFITTRGTRGSNILLHRIVKERELNRKLLPSESVIHVDGNPLNNTRKNLAIVTASELRGIARKTKFEKSSRFKGVSQLPNGLYKANIAKDYSQELIGLFSTEEEAARAYNEAAKTTFKYPKLNNVT
jgi:hypothetical protein